MISSASFLLSFSIFWSFSLVLFVICPLGFLFEDFWVVSSARCFGFFFYFYFPEQVEYAVIDVLYLFPPLSQAHKEYFNLSSLSWCGQSRFLLLKPCLFWLKLTVFIFFPIRPIKKHPSTAGIRKPATDSLCRQTALPDKNRRIKRGREEGFKKC